MSANGGGGLTLVAQKREIQNSTWIWLIASFIYSSLIDIESTMKAVLATIIVLWKSELP